jgi:hypothetical protein
MPVCRQCRHEFDVGRFCTNCGHPVGAPVEDLDVWRTDTAERLADPAGLPVSRPPAPPPVPPTPPSARFPLFADEVDADEGSADELDAESTAERPVPVRSHRAERPWLAWAAGALALIVVAGLGVWLLLGGDSDQDLVAGEPRRTQADNKPADAKEKPAKAEKQKKPKKQKPAKPPRPAKKPTNVARLATATAPETAPPGTDFDGNVVSYEPRNMLDGVFSTCWRMPGDGSGETITLRLPQETRLRSVGLVNGYAKTATDGSGGSLDWYTGNRRILAVEWLFDDGSVVTQDLVETRRLQTTRVDRVNTRTVQLRLITVTEPGQGPARRDYTAISDVALVGSPI